MPPKFQFSSNFTRDPGGHYHQKTHYTDTGKTKEVTSTNGHSSKDTVTISKNPNIVDTNGKIETWDEWTKKRSTKTKIIDPQVEPSIVGYDATQL